MITENYQELLRDSGDARMPSRWKRKLKLFDTLLCE